MAGTRSPFSTCHTQHTPGHLVFNTLGHLPEPVTHNTHQVTFQHLSHAQTSPVTHNIPGHLSHTLGHCVTQNTRSSITHNTPDIHLSHTIRLVTCQNLSCYINTCHMQKPSHLSEPVSPNTRSPVLVFFFHHYLCIL